MGDKTESAVTTWEMLPCLTGATWTDTTGCGSACSFEHAASNAKLENSAIRIVRMGICLIAMRELEGTGQGLQIGDREPVARFAVIIIVAGRYKRILRIHHFQGRRLTGLVAQIREPHTLGGQIGRLL